jgi:hypothetical protein
MNSGAGGQTENLLLVSEDFGAGSRPRARIPRSQETRDSELLAAGASVPYIEPGAWPKGP